MMLERPAQSRTFETQAAELGLDPGNRSPAEATLGYALLGLILSEGEFGAPHFINLFLPDGTLRSDDDMPPILARDFGAINIAPGCWIGDYQADYLVDVCAPGSSTIARGCVECDGHAYHDRTPDQARHDRKRDRDMQAAGIMVLRFTASEIMEDAMECAKSALRTLIRRSTDARMAAE